MPGEVAVAGHVPTFTPSGALQIAQTANVCFKLDALLEACKLANECVSAARGKNHSDVC